MKLTQQDSVRGHQVLNVWVVIVSAVLATLLLAAGGSAFAISASESRDPRSSELRSRRNPPAPARAISSSIPGSIPEGQREIIAAQERGRGLDYVEVLDVTVTRILPEDTQGRRHQKWEVVLASGRTLKAVYNNSISESIPVKVGDVVSMGGQYIYDRSGGLIHWLHADPRRRRPDGYVELNGSTYGEVSRR